MTPDQKSRLLTSLRYWAASYALICGFLFYKSTAPLMPILLAGVVTLLLAIVLPLRSTSSKPE